MAIPFGGVFAGNTMMQSHGVIGGSRSVFVKLSGSKDDLVYVPHGGYLKNPFKSGGKIFAGDLLEYRTDANGENPELFLLKTFVVAEPSDNATIKVYRDGFRHVPSVGDVLMVAPTSLTGTGTAATVTAVVAEEGVWTLTLSGALGSVTKDKVLVEAAEAGSSKKMLVTNPNTFAPCDYDILFNPAANASSFDGARYFLAPVLHGVAYKSRMSAVPACVDAKNKSAVNGWFEL